MLRSGEYNHTINNENIEKATKKAKVALENKLLFQKCDPIKSQRILSVFDSYLEIINKSLDKKPSQNKKSFKEYLNELVKEDPYFKYKSLQANEDKHFKGLLEHLEVKAYYDLPEEISLKLIKVSFNGFTEGLLIYPILDDLDELLINLEDLPNGFQLSGEQDSYFPFEIVFEEFLFILDDDGTIFTYVENFTHDLFLRAGKLLINLATQIYYYAN